MLQLFLFRIYLTHLFIPIYLPNYKKILSFLHRSGYLTDFIAEQQREQNDNSAVTNTMHYCNSRSVYYFCSC